MKKFVLAVAALGALIALYFIWQLADVAPVDLDPERASASPDVTIDATERDADDPRSEDARVARDAPTRTAPRTASLRVEATASLPERDSTELRRAPMPGVVVELWREASGPNDIESRFAFATTSGDGMVLIDPVEPGKYRLRAQIGAKKLVAKRLVLAAGDAHVEELHLLCKGTVRGRVVDARRQPVADAEIRIGRSFEGRAPEFLVRRATRSAADGSFALPYLDSDEYVGAQKAGYGSSPTHPLRQLATGEIELILGDASATVTGLVVDELGAAIPDVTIVLQHEPAIPQRDASGVWVGPRLPVRARSDAQGRFEATGLAPGSWICVAWRLPWKTAHTTLDLAPDAHRVERLVMERRATVFGFVRNERGDPVKGVYVGLTRGRSSQTAVTRDDGAFRFDGVAYAPFKLLASRIASGARSEERSFPAPQTRELRIDIELREGLALRGRATTVAGKALTGFVVRATPLGSDAASNESRARSTDADGAVTFWGLESARYRLSLYPPSATPGSPTAVATDSVTLAEASGEPGGPVVRLVPPIDTEVLGRIRGQCVDDAGHAVSMADITLTRFGSRESWTTRSDAKGSFELADLPRAELRLSAHTGAHVRFVQDVDLRPAATLELRVLLTRAAALRVAFLREDGHPWTDRPPIPWLFPQSGGVLTAGKIDYDFEGHEVIVRGIPHGRYRVTGPHGDILLIRPVDIDLAIGDERRITMRVRVGQRCELTFAGPPAGTKLRVTVRSVGSTDPADTVEFDAKPRGAGADRRYGARATLPRGAVVIEASSDTGERFRLETEVVKQEASSARLEVPRVSK